MFERERAQKKIGYRFIDETLLQRAFTHASYANEHRVESYEELEFLGDSVLQLIVTEFLYRTCAEQANEGDMTSVRAATVCRDALTEAARKLGLDEEISYVGEAPTAATKVLSDVYEAVTGAIYLDGGLDAAREFVLRTHGDSIRSAEEIDTVDYKSKLQEWVQSKERSGTAKLSYRGLGETVADGKKSFLEAVIWRGDELARASGSTRKEAQKAAAKQAYAVLTGQGK